MLAGDRPAEAERQFEQVVAGRVGTLLLGRIVRGEEERRVDVAVPCVAERERGDAVARADLQRLARHLAQPVERYRDVLAERAAPLREDREGGAAAPAPELCDVRRFLRR